jgi:hypothetical protein
MNEPLLELQQVRCSANDRVLLDNVTLCVTGRRAGLSGRTEGIAALLMGEAQLVAGEFKVLGRSLPQARRERVFGCALPPKVVPAKWTIRQVLELAAQVAGYAQSESKQLAASATDRIGEASLSKCVWSRCSPLERNLASLALGLVVDPAILYVRLPIGELPAASCARYGEGLSRATHGIAVLAELGHAPSSAEESEWIRDLDSVVYVFEAGASGVLGTVSHNRMRYLLRVVGESDFVSEALGKAGVTAHAINAPADSILGRSLFLVDVGCDSDAEANTAPLLEACLDLNLELLELTPIARLPGS